MRKVYYFNQLPKKAKKIAANKVYYIEIEKTQDWSIEYDTITEDIKYFLDEYRLDYGKDINWWWDYGIRVNLTSASITDDFLTTVLTPEEVQLINDLHELSGGWLTHRLFHKEYDPKGYQLEFAYSSGGFDEEYGMKFLLKYETDEEIRAQFLLPSLLETELSSEEHSVLESYLEKIGEKLCMKLEEKIHKVIQEMYDKIIKSTQESYDFIGTPEHYAGLLENEDFMHNRYLFNYQGLPILRENRFIDDEFEEVYYDAAG